MTTAGVTTPATGTLTVRKTAEGGIVVESAPSRHAFPFNFLERELGDAIRVQVTVTSDPPVLYEIVRIDQNEWVGNRREPEPIPEPEPPRRRWWQRRKK